MNLKQIRKKDQLELKKIYFDSILSISDAIYSKEQKIAWSSQAWDNKEFQRTINKGKGWLVHDKENYIAFAIRYPKNRIALIYCKGKYQGLGLGEKLLTKIENEARKEGQKFLITEASLIGYKLFQKNNWQIIRKEKINIKNIIFERYKMIKNF